MAGVSGGALASATSTSGGLGFIAAGHFESESRLRDEVSIFKSSTPKGTPLGLGFLSFSSLESDPVRVMDAITEHSPSAVQFFAPSVMGSNIEQAKSLGVTVFAQVGNVGDAREAIEAGVDVIIAQGREAGGHGLRPELGTSTLPLASRIVTLASSYPSRPLVLAAGGIVDGRGLASVLALGCDGAVLGTRLWASKEALGHEGYKRRLVEAGTDDVERIRGFDMVANGYREFEWPYPYDSSGVVKNRFAEEWEGREDELEVALREGEGEGLREKLRRAEETGDAEWGCVYAGEGVGEIKEIEETEAILKRIERQTVEEIMRLGVLINAS